MRRPIELLVGGFFALVCFIGVFKIPPVHATAQINDKFIYKGQAYAISAVEHPRAFFDIQRLGLDPEPMSTACWRGYVATFTIDSDNRLLLTHLSTNDGNVNRKFFPSTAFCHK